MNKERRNRLGKAFDPVTEAEQIIPEVMAEERESMENLPDNFRYGERGDEMQNYIDMMDEVIG